MGAMGQAMTRSEAPVNLDALADWSQMAGSMGEIGEDTAAQLAALIRELRTARGLLVELWAHLGSLPGHDGSTDCACLICRHARFLDSIAPDPAQPEEPTK